MKIKLVFLSVIVILLLSACDWFLPSPVEIAYSYKIQEDAKAFNDRMSQVDPIVQAQADNLRAQKAADIQLQRELAVINATKPVDYTWQLTILAILGGVIALWLAFEFIIHLMMWWGEHGYDMFQPKPKPYIRNVEQLQCHTTPNGMILVKHYDNWLPATWEEMRLLEQQGVIRR